MKPSHLDPRLRELVGETVEVFGQVIRRNAGSELYSHIEKFRFKMSHLHKLSKKAQEKCLCEAFDSLKSLPIKKRFTVAHSFALMLEVINNCENAYRTFKLRERKPVVFKKRPTAIVYVVTAHPTEARSPANIDVFGNLQEVLVEVLNSDFQAHSEDIKNLLETAWRIPITRQRKPKVEDEAEYIYSLVLNEKTLTIILKTGIELVPVFLRSWVGGDKDGHPGVNEKTMLNSFCLSRAFLTKFLKLRMKTIARHLDVLNEPSLIKICNKISKQILGLKKISAGDGARIKLLRLNLRDLINSMEHKLGSVSHSLRELEMLMHVFPALVIPLELRESSDVLLTFKKRKNLTIAQMVKQLAAISRGGDPRWYVRGFIISMASQMKHVKAVIAIQNTYLGALRIPIIPLFEQEQALRLSSELVSEMYDDPKVREAITKYWDGYFEVMCGYSDSAKESGVLQSRVLIAEAVHRLDKLIRFHGSKPLFFHGSGGSVDRGGGSLKEQTAWWPQSSLDLYKATIQGEMVQRTFSSPEIFVSQIEKIISEYDRPVKINRTRNKTLDKFATDVSRLYENKIKDPQFLEVVQKATSYRYLGALHFGSRPSNRSKMSSVSSLRAIPWVMCWTQTRVLFPTWWGIGSAWSKLTYSEKVKLKKTYLTEAMFSSFLKILGFTLAKVDLDIWNLYLEQSGLDQSLVQTTKKEFQNEYKSTLDFVHSISGKKDLLWFRPWLGESIALRAPMINPLNFLQILTLQEEIPCMIRETVAGISNGMLTTG